NMQNNKAGSLTWTRVWRRHRTMLCTAGGLLAFSLLLQALPAKPRSFSGPTSSQPLALSADGELLAVANPDNNTVTFFDTSRPVPQQLEEVEAGREPNVEALAAVGKAAYVHNSAAGTVPASKRK